jgi:hypothetical protein
MGNYLQMAKRQQVLALLELEWSFLSLPIEDCTEGGADDFLDYLKG